MTVLHVDQTLPLEAKLLRNADSGMPSFVQRCIALPLMAPTYCATQPTNVGLGGYLADSDFVEVLPSDIDSSDSTGKCCSRVPAVGLERCWFNWILWSRAANSPHWQADLMEHIREWDAKYGPTRPCCIMQGVGLYSLYRFNGYFIFSHFR